MSFTENPRAIVGDNRAPDYAQRVTDEMREQYRETELRVAELIASANGLPDLVDDESMGPWAKLIKDAKDEERRLDALREAEKAPYFRAAQAVDGYFNSLRERLVRKNRASKPGLADTLQRDVDEYFQRKLAAEQERRRREAEETARIEREKREAEYRAQQEAEEAVRAAERARKPESIEEKRATAVEAQAAAAATKAAAALAATAAEDARIATLAKPADIVRTRVDEGPLVTMGTDLYAIVENYTMIDLETLRPFITHAAIDQALRGWARSTGFSIQMQGARIGRRPKTVVR